MITRREAVKLTLAGAALAARARAASAAGDDALLEAIADTLLPDTPSSPGAKVAVTRIGVASIIGGG